MIKINICLTEQDAINGYTNVSINQLNGLVNGSIDEIIFRRIDGLSYEERVPILSTMLLKMKYNGILILEMLDLMSVGKEMFVGSITSKSLSTLLSQVTSVGYEFDIIDQLSNFPNYLIRNKHSHNHKLTLTIIKNK